MAPSSSPATSAPIAPSAQPTATSVPIAPSAQSTATSSTSSGVSTPAVIGIAVGIGVGVAVIAALITFFIMRRQDKVKRKRDFRNGKQYELGEGKNGTTSKTLASANIDDYLPQPADDKTVQTKTKTLFDQIDLFVENFCLVKPSSEAKVPTAELSGFDTPYLPKPLASLLSRAKDAHPLIKHSLARSITSRITSSASTEHTLLPADLGLLSRAVSVNASKPGFTKCLARWRALTAYIRPDSSLDKPYIADRDRKIAQSVQSFMRAFAPWIDARHQEHDRVQALTTILQEAAGLGIFLLSQPPELVFHWPRENELDPGSLAVKPALLKLTDEHGQKLAQQGQVLVSAPVAKL